MKEQKFERENKKIILGMIIGTVVGIALMLLYMSSEAGWHLKMMQIIIAVALGAVVGPLFGGLIIASLVENKGVLTSWSACFQILGTGILFVLVDFIFGWITKTNDGNLGAILFSNSSLWSLICGMAMGAIFLRKKN
ncbi:hypothetical protein [uncultured Lactobacillus sp.]|uniref:hypothetical protein n=1 Tax=uncultured Lactobacillus sp. TaxID=153152 RepID=UPI00260FE6AB|nr:hypothetical protein [uncultured Lactobacillus sp.]